MSRRPDIDVPPEERPRTPSYWAAKWGVSRWTAIKMMAHIHRSLGRHYVWRAGTRRDYLASEASLANLRVLRASGKRAQLVLDGGGFRAGFVEPGQQNVSEEQFRRALAEIHRRLLALERGGAR